MKSSDVIPKEEQDHFWRVVRDCIQKFHAGCAAGALVAATRLRQQVSRMPLEQMELFYHAEPFEVACDLADNPLDVKAHLDEYLALRDADPQVS